MANAMMQETVWFDQQKYEKAEAQYQEHLAETMHGANNSPAAAASTQEASSNLVNEIARARQHIQTSLNTTKGAANVDQSNRIEKLEKENKDFRKLIDGLSNRIKKLEVSMSSAPASKSTEPAKAEPVKAAPSDDSDSDDLFGSDDDDDEEMAKLAEETKKANLDAQAPKKKTVIGKSTILFAIKGWDDETDFVKLEKEVREIEHQGLRWGTQSELKPVAYSIKKLIMNAIVVDDECGTDFLEDAIGELDQVQSVDIEAFNKI